MKPTTPAATGSPTPVSRSWVPLRARAWWGTHLVAESDAALRVEEDGQPPALYFPVADVRFDLFHDAGRRAACPVKGTARLWSADAPRDEPVDDVEPSGTAWGAAAPAPGDDHGDDLLWCFMEPTDAVVWLAGHVGVDHDRLRVELIDGDPGDPRDVTITRFPTWGDASDLVGLLDVRPDGAGRYLGDARADWRRPVVEGSQMLGQAIVAAMRHTGGRRPVSAHMIFSRAADARLPLELEIDEVTSGRTFSSLVVHVGQQGRPCATATMLLDQRALDVIRHAAPRPDVAGPYDSRPYDMSVTGRDLRIVDGAYTDDPDAPVGPAVLDAWVRFRELPDDPALHAGLLAQFTGHLPIAAALRPHPGIGQREAHRTLSTAINAISISFHAEIRADRWMLYHHRSTFAGDGMSHAVCRVHDEAGALLASFSVDAMIRRFPGAGTADDDRSAL